MKRTHDGTRPSAGRNAFRTTAWLAALMILLFWHGLPACAAQTHATAEAQPRHGAEIDDGPYVDIEGKQLVARWICDDQLIRVQRPIGRSTTVIRPRCAYPDAIRILADDTTPQPEIVTGVARIAVLSDIHGQFDLAVRLLQANGVIDANRRWSYGRGHLVVVGDCFDRGPRVTEVLWLLYGLQQQARKAGGDIHILLGNHEMMTLSGDLRYINEKYTQVASRMASSYPALYSANSVLGRWLRRLPTIVKINDMLFVHGGISPEHLDLGMPLEDVNATYRSALGLGRDQLKADPVLAALHDHKRSPIWYRGYFEDDTLTSERIDAILERLDVRRIVVGHTSMQRIESRFSGRVIAVDTSIKKGIRGELLFIEHGTLQRGSLQGERLPLGD